MQCSFSWVVGPRETHFLYIYTYYADASQQSRTSVLFPLENEPQRGILTGRAIGCRVFSDSSFFAGAGAGADADVVAAAGAAADHSS